MMGVGTDSSSKLIAIDGDWKVLNRVLLLLCSAPIHVLCVQLLYSTRGSLFYLGDIPLGGRHCYERVPGHSRKHHLRVHSTALSLHTRPGYKRTKGEHKPSICLSSPIFTFPLHFSQACSPSDNVAIRIAKLMIVCKSLSPFFIEKNVSALGAYTTL